MPKEFVRVAGTGEVAPGKKKLVRLDDEQILLVNLEGTYYAVDGVCPHALASLNIGQLQGDEIVCPVHGSTFNVKTGEVVSPPAGEGLTRMPRKQRSVEEIIGKLREAEVALAQGETLGACRRIGVSDHTFYRWRREYGGLKVDQAKRLRDMEGENARLRDELLDREVFDTLWEVQVLTEQWRHEYNHVRPHSALNYRPPAPEAARPTFSVPGATSVS